MTWDELTALLPLPSSSPLVVPIEDRYGVKGEVLFTPVDDDGSAVLIWEDECRPRKVLLTWDGDRGVVYCHCGDPNKLYEVLGIDPHGGWQDDPFDLGRATA